MLLKIRHALLEITNHPNTKQSAVIINNEIIITSAGIMQSYVRPMPLVADQSNKNACVSTKIIRKLEQCQLINTQSDDSEESRFLHSLNYQVTFDRREFPQTSTQQGNGRTNCILTRYRTKLLYIFSSEEISRNFHKLSNHSTMPKNTVKQHNEVLLTSFLILTMHPEKLNPPERFQRFLEHITHYLRYQYSVRALDDVLIMCAPFGMENFYKTICIGKVSNVLGYGNGSLFVLSNILPLGCEGSAVFNSKLRLIGLIISTSFQYNRESINMTLVANFAYLMRDFIKQLGIKITSITMPREPSNFAWERFLVIIEAGGNQGTGTFVKVQNKKFILTCSHVVFQVNSKVRCRSVNGIFESEVLWQNPHYDAAFDVALLSIPHNISHRYYVRLAQTKPYLGQRVYNAGFPYFLNFNLKYDFNPSIFQGRVIRYTPAIIMSDGCVQAGQSGGPMLDKQGNLMGVCVSNMKVDDKVYPNFNTAVPIISIRSILEDYAQTNDIRVLNNLVANQDIQKTWSLADQSAISKL
uniref:Peroxisomal leader peptide-processing protease n=1 Tax=Glossina brevipalpis TaxID=37001 RepID=A0A1A9WJX7_9MUSC